MSAAPAVAAVASEAIVLAGGLGTRLRGTIGELPKPLAPVAGRPFLEWQLEALARRGIGRVVLSTGYRAEAIRAHFGDRYGALELAYCVEAEPLGTGGAILAALAHVRGDSAFVLNGDTYMRSPLGAMRARAPGELVVLVARVEDAGRFGTVVLEEGRIARFLEKGATGPGLVNSGVYLVPRGLFEGRGLPGRFSFERDYLEPVVAREPVAAVVTDEPFVDIGIPESLAAASLEIPRLAAADG